MTIQTVIANLLNTIEGKEQLLAQYKDAHATAKGSEDIVTYAMVRFLEINLEELNIILNDCMAVREADIVRDLEMKELKRQNSEYGWMVSPDRMGQ